MINFRKSIFALTSAIVLGGMFTAAPMTEAEASTKVKPSLSVSGKAYYNKSKAESSALGRWEKKATIKHGFEFSHWSKAKKRGVYCNADYHKKNGRKLWTCAANGKPAANIKTCKSGAVSSAWFHPSKQVAKPGARKAWEKLAAQQHGMKFSFWKNAKNKSTNCVKKNRKGQQVHYCVYTATACR